MAENYRRKRKKIVFFGDSITAYGARPGGFIRRIEQLLKEGELEGKYELSGAGVDGNTVLDLYERVEKDVLFEGADIVVIFIGINDVWQKLIGKGVYEFEATYEDLIKKLISAEIKVVLCTPTVIGEKKGFQNEQDEDLEIYSETIRNLAARYSLAVVDLRRAFLQYILINNPDNQVSGLLTFDTVHLNNEGNQLVAEEMWKVLHQIK